MARNSLPKLNIHPTLIVESTLLSRFVPLTDLVRIIHFHTTNTPMDVITTLDYACSHFLYSRPRFVLETLVTGDQISVFGDRELVVPTGMAIIPPSLTQFEGPMRWGVGITKDVRAGMEYS